MGGGGGAWRPVGRLSGPTAIEETRRRATARGACGWTSSRARLRRGRRCPETATATSRSSAPASPVCGRPTTSRRSSPTFASWSSNARSPATVRRDATAAGRSADCPEARPPIDSRRSPIARRGRCARPTTRLTRSARSPGGSRSTAASSRRALTVATSAPQWQRLQTRETNAATASHEEADGRLLSVAETEALVSVPGLHGGRYTPHAARIDPARLVRALAVACERHGVTIYERSAATALERGRVRCGSLSVRAEVVIRATESYTTQMRGSRLRYLPLYSLMIATAPLDDAVWRRSAGATDCSSRIATTSSSTPSARPTGGSRSAAGVPPTG